jgi:hypothetical protein
MKRTLLAVALGAAAAFAAAEALALPVAPSDLLASAAPVADVAQGCGRGMHRGPRGFCRPNRWGGPPPMMRRCWVRPTPWGPRRVCR